MKTSELMKNKIKSYEKLRLHAYDDNGRAPGGTITIGWGHTGDVKLGDTLKSQAEADALFEKDIAKCEAGIDRLVTVCLTQGQFDAIVDFIFNMGEGALRGSTFLRYVNAGRHKDAANQLPRWVYAFGKVNQTLVERRNFAAALYNGGPL